MKTVILDNIEVSYNKRIIVMVGLPGSGKSTWRDKFLASTDDEFVIISSDDEIERLCAEDGITYSEGFEKYVGKATGIVKQKFKESVNNGRNIIWDQTNLTPKKRKGILKKLPDDYLTEAVAFELTLEELQSRLDKRESETGKRIPPEVVKSMANSYIPPTKGEGFDKVTIVN